VYINRELTLQQPTMMIHNKIHATTEVLKYNDNKHR